MDREKINTFGGGVITGIGADQLPDDASPFAQNAVIDQVAAGGGRVRRRKGAVTRTQTPLSGEPAILGIFVYPTEIGRTLILAVGADGTLQVEGQEELLPLTPTPGLGSPYFTDALSWWMV